MERGLTVCRLRGEDGGCVVFGGEGLVFVWMRFFVGLGFEYFLFGRCVSFVFLGYLIREIVGICG